MNTEPLSVPALRFKVAFSYPGELRPLVEKVARLVANRCGEEHVLYDRFHQAEFARLDLDVHLPGLYRTESALIVVFLCNEYLQKEWCKLEFGHIRELANTLESERIMLLSRGQVDLAVLGLQGGGPFCIDSQSQYAIAKKILERLEIEKAKNPNFLYKRAPSSRNLASAPRSAPTRTPLADDLNHSDTLAPIATQSESPPVVALPPAVVQSPAPDEAMTATRPSPGTSNDAAVTIPSPPPRKGLGRLRWFAVAAIGVLVSGAGGIHLMHKQGETATPPAPARHDLPAQVSAVATATTQPLSSSPTAPPSLASSQRPTETVAPAAKPGHMKDQKNETPKHPANTGTGGQRAIASVKRPPCTLDMTTKSKLDDGLRLGICVAKRLRGEFRATSGSEQWICKCP
jgi:hypothetical protein